MTDPHLGAEAITWAAVIVASHRTVVGHDLIKPVPPEEIPDALYHFSSIVVAHDAAADPCFVYANAAAQQLWGYPWAQFVGLPSRLSAPPEERGKRGHLLADGQRSGVVIGRDLVRIAADGRRFVVAEVVLWNLVDASGTRIGQAATYDRWRWLE
ncbi:MEKHLA domain-containing protein [Planctomycetota bacterium]|nr:MEKHLA domain-containing protein [Planctomycetota bacterium]